MVVKRMQHWASLALLALVACTEPTAEDDAVLPPDDSDRPEDPCLSAFDLFEWVAAIVRADGVVVHQFREGVNGALTVPIEGTLVSRSTEECPGGFAVRQEDGSLLEVELCVDSGPALDALPADGRQVSGRFENLETTRGEFRLFLTDADGPLLSVGVDGEGDSSMEPWRVTPDADVLVCSDGEAYQSLLFAYSDTEQTVIDSGGQGTLSAGGHSFSLRAHIAARGPLQRHLFKWSGAIYTIHRDEPVQ